METCPIPDDFTGEYCRYAVCWPSSPQWLAVLRGLYLLAGSGRYYDGNTGSVTTAQEIIKETWDYNFRQEEVIMACGDSGLSDIAVAINNLATATANASATANATGDCGCQGSSGGGQYPAPNSPTEQPPSITDPPPTGYDSWEQFFTQKCGVAYDIIAQARHTLTEMLAIAFGGLTLEGLIELLIIAVTLTISSAGLAAIAALLLTVVATVIITSVLNIINDNESDLICALYEGTTSGDSRSRFLSVFNAAADAGIADPIENYAVKALMSFLLEPAETNRLYTLDTRIDYSGHDCSACSGHTVWDQCNDILYQTFDLDPANQIDITSVQNCGIGSSCYSATIWFDNDGGGAGHFISDRKNYTVTVSGLSGGSCGPGPYNRFFYLDEDLNTILQTDTQDPGQECAILQVVLDGIYTLTFDFVMVE